MMTENDEPPLPAKIKKLHVTINDTVAGSLVRESQYVFTYAQDDLAQPPVGLYLTSSPPSS